MSQTNELPDGIPTGPLPDAVVKTSLVTSITIVVSFVLFMLLTGFTRVVSLPTDIAGPPGPIQVAIGPQGGTQTPDLSDEGATGPQGLLGSVLVPGPQGPKGDTGATGATGATGPMGPTGPQGPPGSSGIDGSNNSPGEGVAEATCVSQLLITTPVDTSNAAEDTVSSVQISGDLSKCAGETLRARVALERGGYVWAVFKIPSNTTEVIFHFDLVTGDFYDTKPKVVDGNLVSIGMQVPPVSVQEFGRTTITIAKKWQ